MSRTLIALLIAAASIVILAGIIGAWIVFGPNTATYSDARSLKIPPGSSFSAVVDSLESAEILGSASTFSLVARATGWGSQIKAGHYRIEAGASNYDLLSTLRRGLQAPIRMTVPPGTRPEVMAALAGTVMYFDREDMEAALRDPELAAELGTDTLSLFGYMLPESYDFYWLTDARTVVRRIKQYFDSFYEAQLADAARERALSADDIVNLASIVEWETHVDDERPRVAGVYLNRMRIGMPLQADPTVQYAVMRREGQKRRLLFVDYQIEDPFNTYRFQGLPPGPITNPSRASLLAAARAEEHDYLYFVATGDGGHIFSRTFQEHTRAANRYRQLMQERRRQQQSSATGAE